MAHADARPTSRSNGKHFGSPTAAEDDGPGTTDPDTRIFNVVYEAPVARFLEDLGIGLCQGKDSGWHRFKGEFKGLRRFGLALGRLCGTAGEQAIRLQSLDFMIPR